MRSLRRVGTALALVGVALVGLATPAFAHNSLTSSNPEDKATMDAGPKTIELRFDQPVQDGECLNTISVTGPDGKRWDGGQATVDSAVVSAPLRDLGPEGVYTIGYRIVSADGHPVKGELRFTLTKAGTGTPAPAGADSSCTASDSGSSGGDNGGLPIWVWIAGAVVVLGGGLVLALRIGGKSP